MRGCVVPRYTVDSSRTKMAVKARSSIHDTTTTFTGVSGTVDADPDALDQAKASFTVTMADFDAGDWLKNRKMKKELDPDKYPRATFELTAVRDITKREDGSFEAVADGVLRYRNRELKTTIAGKGTMDDGEIAATGKFDLDLRDFGMKPPRFLMFKMEPELTLEVTLRARS